MKDLNIYSTNFITFLQGLTEDELKTLDNTISNEKKRREEKTRIELIENFRNAFMAILREGIGISINGGCIIADETYITNFDDFNFY